MTHKFIIAGASILALASSFVVAPVANAQTTGTFTGGAGGNLVFCGTAGTTSSVVAGVTTPLAASQNLGSSASFSAGGTVRVAYNSKTPGNGVAVRGLDDNNRCIDANVAVLTFTPRIDFSRHTTRFQIRLDNNGGIELTQVDINNSAPSVDTNSICIAPNSRARFTVRDSENDTVTTLVNSPSNGTVNSGSTYIDYTPNTDFVGTDTMSIELQDNIMSDLSSNVALGGAAGAFTGLTGSVLPNVTSGTNPVKQTLTVVVSSNCPAMMSSSSSSMMMNSSSSSMMSSSSSSMMMNSSSSSAKTVYVDPNTGVGKGGTTRTGASN